jgi:phytoene dehydrogenase-like protein
VPGLYCCGDSRFPGIGLPAVAASGAITANTLVPAWDHIKLLDELAV